MSDPKRQHFIPCCYLKFFSRTGSREDSRNTQIWFTDGVISKFSAVNNLGVEKYTYSKENPEFDRQFNDMERDYPQIIEKLLDGQTSLSPRDYFSLYNIMVDFNLRNVAYINRSEVERMHVYEGISRRFNQDVYTEAQGAGTDLKGMWNWLKKTWRVQRIQAASKEKFITSDNPSTIFHHPKTDRPLMIYLPAHPDLGLVAYDRRYLKLTEEEISDNALGILNALQINRCVRHTFADHDLAENMEAWAKIQKIYSIEKPSRWVDIEHWKPDFISIDSPDFNKLTFAKKLNPETALSQAIRKTLY